ncbi:MAG TPA: SRPBCC family protein [Fimbriimonadaceae bacterium]|nr:SRPBCC family protein [Fimbriimonadaceae bacterium]
MIKDTIERVLTLKAPIERVYKAVSDKNELCKWFPDRIEGQIKAGEDSTWHFDECGSCRVHVVGGDPYGYFAFRWVPGASGTTMEDVLSVPNTLVEFRLEEEGDGTRLTMLESGFSSLPPEVYESALRENNAGWDSELAELVKFVEQA